MSSFGEKKSPEEHISGIFGEYTTPSRVLRSFTNLSNTVIQTALSGQNKFVYEILQNADDSFEDERKAIEVQFILDNNYLIVHHNGKVFDYNDVERICDYASQIEDVKATDLSKTGYKGLGFKSLFNLSDCIYIYSNGYSFRFDKTHWPDSSSKPWQVIPIWCRYNELPLNEKYSFDQPVNFILRVNDLDQLKSNLTELVDQPEVLLYLNRIDKLSVTFDGGKYFLERKVEALETFNKVDIYNNRNIASTWLLKTYKSNVPARIREFIRGGSRYVYPDKIKTAEIAPFTFAVQSNETLEEISKLRGLCHSTLPTQLHLSLPYHINSFFILNLDRTQLHENEWNEFLINQIGHLQLSLLKDLAELPHLKNYVIMLFVREIQHPYGSFIRAFSEGFNKAKSEIAWLPAYQGSRLLKLGEAWIDETKFFGQNFQYIRNDEIEPRLIDYDVKQQSNLLWYEAKSVTFEKLFIDFCSRYYPQLTKESYLHFITYIFKSHRSNPYDSVMEKLRQVTFLVSKNKTLLSPENALLEESENPIPSFLMLNPVDNEYLPSENTDSIKEWLVTLGARRLMTPIQVVRESVLKWIDDGFLGLKYERNHVDVLNYLAVCFRELTNYETEKFKKNLRVLTESNEFEKAELCFFPDAVPVKELASVISDGDRISSCYSMYHLRNFFERLGVNDRVSPLHVLQKIISWIKNDEMYKIIRNNYAPIMEYISQHYPSVKHALTGDELKELKKLPVLTCDQSFQKAKDCYLASAVIEVKGLECVIPENRLVSTETISSDVKEFLEKIGVSTKISPTEVVRRSLLKWIKEGEVHNRITLDNHDGILKYIAANWSFLYLDLDEKEALKKMPLMTESNTLRAACECYMPTGSDNTEGKIPGLECIISSEEFVSSGYYKSDDIDKRTESDEVEILLMKTRNLLPELGVRSLKFVDICEKYCHNLTSCENVKWFFSELKRYWPSHSKNKIFKCLQQKFKSSCLLPSKGNMRLSTDLYSAQFKAMHDIDPNSVPLLDFVNDLPEDLEKFLGFKTELELTCITRLLEAIRENPKLGEEKTCIFFTTLLEQLRQKRKDEIGNCQLYLLSQDNKLKPGKDLYYFIEEEDTCHLNSCYLKRIHGMTHKDTLELAKLCGVNTLQFEQEVIFGELTPYNTLREFYINRLPFFVLQESKKLNEPDSTVLECLYEKIYSIELYTCSKIEIKYPFGSPCGIPFHFENLKMYTTVEWNGRHRSNFHKHLKEKLGFKSDITEIIDMNLNSEDKEGWLRDIGESSENLQSVEEKLEILKAEGTLISFTDENLNHSSEFDDGNGFRLEGLTEKEPIAVKSSSAETKSRVACEKSTNFSEAKSRLQAHSSSDESSVNPSVQAKPILQTQTFLDENFSKVAVEDKLCLQVQSTFEENLTDLSVEAESCLQTQSSVENSANMTVDTKPCLQTETSDENSANVSVYAKPCLQTQSFSHEKSTSIGADACLQTRSSSDENSADLSVGADPYSQTLPFFDENLTDVS